MSETQSQDTKEQNAQDCRSAFPSIEGVEIIGVVGTGGMATVYKGVQAGIERIVAVKVLHRQHCTNATIVQRFNREARLTRFLDHPNIGTIYSFGTEKSSRPYLLMEYVEGITLATLLKTKAPLQWPLFLEIFSQCCAALSHAHAHGIVHRDLKPGNVLLVEKNGHYTVKVLDFGLAKLLASETDEGELQRLTRTGAILGSPHYMSPEQCTGQEADNRTDIYSLGCMMYEAVCGRTPFAGDNALETMSQHVDGSSLVPPHLVLKAGVNPILEHVILKSLSKDPGDRYENAAALLKDLQSISGRQQLMSGKPKQKSWQVGGTGPVTTTRTSTSWRLAIVSVCVMLTVAALLFMQHCNRINTIGATRHALDVGDVIQASDRCSDLLEKPDIVDSLPQAILNLPAIKAITRNEHKKLIDLCVDTAQVLLDEQRDERAQKLMAQTEEYASVHNMPEETVEITLQRLRMYVNPIRTSDVNMARIADRLHDLYRLRALTPKQLALQTIITAIPGWARADEVADKYKQAIHELAHHADTQVYFVEAEIDLVSNGVNSSSVLLSDYDAAKNDILSGNAAARLMNIPGRDSARQLARLVDRFMSSPDYKGDKPRSTTYLSTVFDKCSPGSRLMEITLNHAADVQSEALAWKPLLTLATKGLRLAQQRHNTVGIADAYYRMATGYAGLENYKQAIDYLRMSMELRTTVPDPDKESAFARQIQDQHTLAQFYYLSKQLDAAAKVATALRPDLYRLIALRRRELDCITDKTPAAVAKTARENYGIALRTLAGNFAQCEDSAGASAAFSNLIRETKAGRANDPWLQSDQKRLAFYDANLKLQAPEKPTATSRTKTDSTTNYLSR